MKTYSTPYVLGYVCTLGVSAALLLTGVGQLTRPLKEANAKADKIRNILGVLGVPVTPGARAQELAAAFEASVRVDGEGHAARYRYVEGGETRVIAVPVDGPGLWGPIHGFLALEPDLRTIRGITFHEQEETPGLGGEIASPAFRQKFAGKSIVGADGTPGFFIRPAGSAAPGPNEIDGITGATLTCDKVAAMLNRTIAQLKEEPTHGGN